MTDQRWDKGLLLNVGLSLLTEGATTGVVRGVGWVADQVNVVKQTLGDKMQALDGWATEKLSGLGARARGVAERFGGWASDRIETVSRQLRGTASAAELAGTECSFSADTPVAMEHGEQPISQLEVGARVLAYNETLDATDSYTVTAVLAHDDPTVVYVTIEGETLETTPEHPFYTEERGWVAADDLQIGEHVRKADGSDGVVQAVKRIQRLQRMYNLTVDRAHTFFVGQQRWLVHNTCGSKRVLVVGESGTLEYSRKLLEKNPGWDITATTHDNIDAATLSKAAGERGPKISIPEGADLQKGVVVLGKGEGGQLKVMTGVDARHLAEHPGLAGQEFDAVIFNNPYAGPPNTTKAGRMTASLIREFIKSAPALLGPEGKIHINVTQKLLEYKPVQRSLQVPSFSGFERSPYYAGRFGDSGYYARYQPRYSSGDVIHQLGYEPRLKSLLNFIIK